MFCFIEVYLFTLSLTQATSISSSSGSNLAKKLRSASVLSIFLINKISWSFVIPG